MDSVFSSIPSALEALKRGEFVVVVDDPKRENEGDLFLAAEKMTTEKMAFMLQHTSGVMCVSMTRQRLEALALPPMVTNNTEAQRASFTVSVDYRKGTTTGISAADRALTVRALADPESQALDFRRPGHVFPLQAQDGGVLKRPGHTEAMIDLLQLAGLQPVGAICEIVNKDYSMARLPQLVPFAKQHGLLLVTIADLIAYRKQTEKIVRKVSQAPLPTPYGDFTACAYESLLNGVQHFVLVKGEIREDDPILVRVHSECLTGDLFQSKRCDCGLQLEAALKAIAEAGRGILIYLRGHEGRGIGLAHKLETYLLQDQGMDTVEANEHLGLPIDARDYIIAGQILSDLNVKQVRLLTNNPKKYFSLLHHGVEIMERIPLISPPTPENKHYLKTKQVKLGHVFEFGPFPQEETEHAHF